MKQESRKNHFLIFILLSALILSQCSSFDLYGMNNRLNYAKTEKYTSTMGKKSLQEISNSVPILLTTLSDHSYSVEAIEFSPDGRALVSGSSSGDLIIFLTENGSTLASMNDYSVSVSIISFHAKGTFFSVNYDYPSGIGIYNTKTFSRDSFRSNFIPGTWGAPNPGIKDLVFSYNSSCNMYLAAIDEPIMCTVADEAGNIMIWTNYFFCRKSFWTVPTENLSNLVFNSNAQILATGTTDGVLELWDVSSGTLLDTLTGHTSGIHSLQFTSDSSVLASGSNGTINLWNVSDGSLIHTLNNHSDIVTCLAFQPGDSILASGSTDQTVKIWNASAGTLIETFSGHSDTINNLAFHPGGWTLASASADRTIKMWNILPAVTPSNATDYDFDGMPNTWEEAQNLDPMHFWDKFQDNDGDKLSNYMEYLVGTDPHNSDSDNDTIDDHYEYFNQLNNTRNDANEDRDGDGMLNWYEYQCELCADIDDTLGDNDADGLSNLEEYQNNTLANDYDSDDDGLSDHWELKYSNTNPWKNDTDEDGMPDGWEVNYYLDPLVNDSNKDPDRDGYTNIEEYINGTNPIVSEISTTSSSTTTTTTASSTSEETEESKTKKATTTTKADTSPSFLYITCLMVFIVLIVFYRRQR
ncbi:MAG: hypothetical protein ACFFB5_12990 [Promethearchaeota archaeon]